MRRHIGVVAVLTAITGLLGAASAVAGLPQDIRSAPPDGFTFDFGRWPYPLNEEVGAELQALAGRYPNLARLQSIAKTRKGRDLWVLEITNQATGTGTSKPGLWLDGNIHAGELTGRAYLQYFAARLLYSYGKDDLSTELVDTRTFYVMPVFDADGGDLLLSRHPAWAGHVAGEHPGEDLDGDGYITQMRVPDSSSDDGYRTYPEGLDPNRPRRSAFLDRRRRHPLTGEREGADFNRNWSAEWRADEPGAGPRPFSLPEVAAVADFILEHDNIFFTYTIHSGGGARSYMVRPPMNQPYDWMPGEDHFFYKRLGNIWAALSKGGITENNYYSFLFNTSLLDDNGEQRGYSETMVGFAADWAYMDAGIHSLTPEVNGSGWDYDGDGWIRPQEEERWHREEKGGMFDSPWVEYDHPELGMVEIGGSRGIPPALDETLQEHSEIQYDYLLHIASLSPLIRVVDLVSESLGGARYRITASIQNQGGVATYVTQRAIDIRRDKPVVVAIDVDGGEIVEGETLSNIGHLAGFIAGHEMQAPPIVTVEWIVESAGSGPVSVSVEVHTPKAGEHSATMRIGQ